MSGFSIIGISNILSNSIGQQESNLQQLITNLQNNPNASTQDLLALQANMATWQAAVTANSSIIKAMSDTTKTVCNNIGA
jgi:hypothetical protein